MLLTMAPQQHHNSSNAPVFNLDCSQFPPATPHHQAQHRPSISSPLSSSPIRASRSSPVHYGGPSSPPPLSPRDINTLPRRGAAGHAQSSPVQCSGSFSSIFSPAVTNNAINNNSNRFSKYASRSTKPNPLRQSRETAQDSRRRLFLKNVRQRADDKSWERRGGDQEVLRLEWAVLDRKWREQKNADADGILYEDDIDEFQQYAPEQQTHAASANYFAQHPHGLEPDEMMADAMALEEQRELDAMLSMLEPQATSSQSGFHGVPRPTSPSMLSEDEYDDLFMDLASEEQQGSQEFVCSGEMDMS